MGTERHNGFPAEIVLLQKCVKRLRQIRPSIGIAKKNYVIAVHIIDMSGKFRPRILILLFPRKIKKCIMGTRIFLCGLDFKQIAVGDALDNMRDKLRIAYDLTVYHYAAGPCDCVHTIRFWDTKVSNENVGAG